MLRKVILMSAVVLIVSFTVNCATHVHTIGKGPQTEDVEKIKARQWYILWGLVPLNNVDTKTMAGSTVDYEIVTEMEPVDILINMVTDVISVNCRSVTVTKQNFDKKKDIASTK